MRPALMCDFDETIVGVDTGALILSKFAVGDWRYYDKLYDRNGMPIEEVMRRQFSTVRATKSSMIGAIEGSARFRPGSEQLLRVCDEERVPFVVVSYGLDFCIRHVLDKVTPPRHLRIRAPRARVTRNGIRFVFPRLYSRGSVNLKDDLVRRYKMRGSKVVFVGDGTSDFPAIESADVRFAIRGSSLAEICDRRGVRCSQITSFGVVADAVRALSRAGTDVEQLSK